MSEIKVGINVSDNGSTAKVTKEAILLKDKLEGAALAANLTGKAVRAARASVDASSGRGISVAAARAETQEYGKQRSVGPGTGAEGRDFAKQAQGLGGLVHVYATFAANLFAVSAAFGALSRAADTTNMVKGLDQLGASSGRNLGSLAKQLTMVTDGAISLRDAMTATAQASAGGMTNAAILRMGNVAKQASQALGIAMPDAMSRLSRGITKLEPELLDEIGIMVRVDKASQEYARTLGKSASALTDFEKRQGFANAVLEQGERKFGAIKIDANPYSKILASMENLAQSGLELVNKVLGPLLKLLSTSPTALATAMAGIAMVLLKQAIPAIGMFRENAKRMSDETHARVKRQVAEQSDAASQMDVIAAKRAEKEYLTVGAGLKRVEELRKASFSSAILGYEVRGLLKKSPLDLTKAESDMILSKHKELQDKITAGTAGKGESDQYAKLEARAEQVKKLNNSISKIGDAAADANERRDATWWSHQKQKEDYLTKLERKAAKSGVVSSAADNAAVMGPAYAFSTLKKDLADLEGNRLSKIGTAIKGTFAIATSAVGTAINAFGLWGQAIGIAIGGLTMLSNWLSSNGAEADKLNISIEGLSSSVENMSRTLNAIASKDPLAVFSVETIQARANALQGLSDSLSLMIKDFDRLRQASNGWDNLVDSLWDAIGRGAADKLSTNIAKAISSGLSGLSEGSTKDAAISKLKEILGKDIDVTNIKQVNTELRKLGNPEVQAAGALIDKIFKDASREANNTANTLTTVVGSLGELAKLVQTQKAALTPTDAVGKLGATMMSSAGELSKALKEPINSILILNDIARDSNKLSLLSPETGGMLLNAKKGLEELSDAHSTLQKQTVEAQNTLQKLKESGKDTKRVDTKEGIRRVDTEETVKAKEMLANLAIATAASETKIKTATTELSAKVSSDFVNVGMKNLASSLATAVAEGGIIAARGYLGVLKEAGMQTAEAEGKLRLQEIGAQKQVLDATYAQIRQQQKNANVMEINNVLLETVANELALSYARTPEAETAAKDKKKSLDVQLKEAIQKSNITNMSPQQASKLRGGGEYSDKVLSDMSGYLSTMTGYLSGIAKLGGQAAAAKIETFARTAQEETAAEQKINTGKVQGIDRKISVTSAKIAASSEYDAVLQAEKDSLELEKRTLLFKNQNLDTEKNLKVLAEVKNRTKVDEVKHSAAILSIETQAAENKAKFNQDNKNAITASLNIELKGLEEVRAKNASIANTRFQENQAIASAQLAKQESELQYLNTIGVLTEEDFTRKTASIALEQQSLQYKKESADLEAAMATKRAALAITITQQLNEGVSIAGSLRDSIELEASYARQKTALDLINQTKVTSIILTAEHKALQEAQAAQMERMVSITESLSIVFGDLGTNIGKVGESILKMAKDDESYLVKKKKLQEDLAASQSTDGAGSDTKAEEKATKGLIKLEKDRVKSELDGYAKTAGAAKKLFKEKTVAYKILDTIEKTAHIVKMGIMATELVADITGTTASVANSATRSTASVAEAGVDGVKAVIKAIAAFPPPLNFIAGAAVAAAVGSLLGSIGGSAPEVPKAGFNAKDMQETQGTGQKWVDGKKVDTGGGVFGDSEAKSASIVNSLEILKDNSNEEMFTSNKMVELLTAISDGINGVAKGIYAVVGIRTGSISGTKEGESGKSTLGWGTKKNTEIVNSGIAVKGSFGQLMGGAAGTTTGFEDVLTTSTKSSWFGIKKKTTQDLKHNTIELDADISNSLTSVFKNAGSLFVSLGKKLGMTTEQVLSKLGNIPVDKLISLRGLKGAELETELSAVLGSILDDTAATLFEGLTKYQNFGEGMLETAIRVVDGLDKVNVSLKSIGMSSVGVGMAGIEVSEVLIEAAGGLDSFISKVNFFSENFLTDAERLAPVSQNLAFEMGKLGLSGVTTRDQFRDTVKGLDLTTEGGRTMYTALMNLAPAFDKVAKAVEGIQAVIDGVHQSVVDTKFGMRYGMASNEDKYGMLDTKLATTDEKMRKPGTDIYTIGKLADDQISMINQAWGLLSPEQQASTLTAYEAKLDAIDAFVTEKGANAIQIAQARDEATAKTIADAVQKAMREELFDAMAQMTAAAANIQSAADTPAVINVNVSAPAKSEVSISQPYGDGG